MTAMSPSVNVLPTKLLSLVSSTSTLLLFVRPSSDGSLPWEDARVWLLAPVPPARAVYAESLLGIMSDGAAPPAPPPPPRPWEVIAAAERATAVPGAQGTATRSS